MVTEAEKRRVGALIRHRRQVLDLSQTGFAGRVGVSRNAVSKWETGLSYPLRHAGKIEAVLGISLSANGVTRLPPADPQERELWDLAVVDAGPEGAWAVVEEYRRRVRGRPA